MKEGYRTLYVTYSKESEVYDGLTPPEQADSYYRAFLGNDGRHTHAELIGKGSVHERYWFDTQGRVVRIEESGDVVIQYDYRTEGSHRIIDLTKRAGGKITYQAITTFDRDGWRMKSVYRGEGGVLRGSVNYNYDKKVYIELNSEGEVIEERKPRIPRQADLAYQESFRKRGDVWPKIKFVPCGKQDRDK
jgi:hypothetical protein